jgi:hypothetical protein
MAPPANGAQANSAQTQNPPPPLGSNNSAPAGANKSDLIDKKWVGKAKKIFLDNRNDPYRQVQEIDNLKAQYMRETFGRETKAGEG